MLIYDMVSVGVCRSRLARGISSVGRVLRSHRRGQGFESPILHLYIRKLNVAFRKLVSLNSAFQALTQ